MDQAASGIQADNKGKRCVDALSLSFVGQSVTVQFEAPVPRDTRANSKGQHGIIIFMFSFLLGKSNLYW